jgi:pyridoxamine 5'-phosphate oxidase family protein
MSVFTPSEIEYLRGQSLGRLATVGPDNQPHVIPVTFWFNAEEDAIDIGGINFAAGKKWRDAQHNPKVTFLVDDSPAPGHARAVEVRGVAELHTTGGEEINPRFPNFADEFFRLRPTRIVSWDLEDEGKLQSAASFRPNARSVR